MTTMPVPSTIHAHSIKDLSRSYARGFFSYAATIGLKSRRVALCCLLGELCWYSYSCACTQRWICTNNLSLSAFAWASIPALSSSVRSLSSSFCRKYFSLSLSSLATNLSDMWMKGPFNSQVECSSSLAAARRVSEEENGQNSRGNVRVWCIGGMVMIVANVMESARKKWDYAW